MTTNHLVHFTLDFDGITSLVRDLWSEGSYDQARNILSSCSIPTRLHERIILGSLRIAQDPNGKEGISGIVLEDNWQPNLAQCSYGLYPKFNELSTVQEKIFAYKERYFLGIEKTIYWLRYEIERKAVMERRLHEIYTWFDSLPEDFIDWANKNCDDWPWVETFIRTVRFAEEGGWTPSLGIQSLDPIEDYVQHQIELEDTPTPEPGTVFASKHGWILPDGKYYPCGRTEHVWLADRLGKTEIEAEEANWIKVGSDLQGNPTLFPGKDRKPTQRQLNAVFDWCQVHGMENLWWIEELDPLS